ncbi:MAG: hypothetical protein AAFY48_04520 [Bacteroidota bacterium]
MYSSLELFTVLRKGRHAASVQRIRLGLDHRSYQFGLGLNLLSVSTDWTLLDDNLGLFIRHAF